MRRVARALQEQLRSSAQHALRVDVRLQSGDVRLRDLAQVRRGQQQRARGQHVLALLQPERQQEDVSVRIRADVVLARELLHNVPVRQLLRRGLLEREDLSHC